ncbi:MAG TPA: VOC family protein [Acidimicrobiia bacterium]|nr:VOC family protein [Acidimicrobiia bacterium]
MRLQPIVYTQDVARAVTWYAVVLGHEPGYQSDAWTSFSVGDASLGIHHVEGLPVRGRVELALVTTEPLEDFVARVGDEGIEPVEPIREQPFGRSVLLKDPDGTPVQVNEHRSAHAPARSS